MGFSVTVSRCGTTVEAQYRAGRHTVLYCAVLYCAILYCTVVAYSSFELCPVRLAWSHKQPLCLFARYFKQCVWQLFQILRSRRCKMQHNTSTVPYSIAHCTVLYCAVLYCIVLCSVVMWYSVLSCSVPYKSSMHTRSSATVPKLTGYNTP